MSGFRRIEMNTDKERFEALLCASADEIPGLAEGETWSFLAGLDPDIAAMKGYDQKHPYHCYDLLMHTLHTAAGLDKSRLEGDAFRILRIAAFLHDIGKPASVQEKTTAYGTVLRSFHGHAEYSDTSACRILARLGYGDEDIRKIRIRILAHDLFLAFHFAPAGETSRDRLTISEENVMRVIDRFRRNYPELRASLDDFADTMLLSAADGLAHSAFVFNPDGTLRDSREYMLARAEAVREVILRCKEDL